MAGPPIINLLSILKTLGIFVSSTVAKRRNGYSGMVRFFASKLCLYVYIVKALCCYNEALTPK